MGRDFNFTPGTLAFAPGVIRNSFTLSVAKEATYQGAKTVIFGLTNASNAAIGSNSNQTVLIIDPEDRPVPTSYYVDSVGGNDANSGTNIAAPLAKFDQVERHHFQVW